MSVLAADKLMMKPKLYSTFLLWLLSELYSTLPEVGDMDLPKLVFFFDEAHMLFDDTPKALADKILLPSCPIRREAYPEQGRGCLFRDPESDGHPGEHSRTARQQGPACAEGVHA